ncbi:MAG: flavin reductase [Clostridia bacterium]|nr:flavin reductase [Clostridia bacterium]
MKAIDIRAVKENVVQLIGDGWGLLTAGTAGSFNTMTVSWGALGELWGKDVAIVFVRPQRYTLEFLEREDRFTLSFYDPAYRPALALCGSKSGRDLDKAAAAGLTPAETDGTITFAQAKLTLVCRKIAVQALDPAGFLDPAIESNYDGGDYHKVFIGEILKVYEA